MNCGIYCIENLINGKKYIGYSMNIADRWKHHKKKLRNNYHENSYLLHSWNKHGENNFKFWIIEEYINDEIILKLMEIYFISYYNSFYTENGYNLTRGGDGCFCRIASNTEKENKSKKLSGKNNPMYGKRHSAETKRLLSEKAKNQKRLFGKENSMFGKHLTKDHKKKLSAKLSGSNNPNYGKTGTLSPAFGRKHSDEERLKISNSKKEYWRKKHEEKNIKNISSS